MAVLLFLFLMVNTAAAVFYTYSCCNNYCRAQRKFTQANFTFFERYGEPVFEKAAVAVKWAGFTGKEKKKTYVMKMFTGLTHPSTECLRQLLRVRGMGKNNNKIREGTPEINVLHTRSSHK